MKKTKPRIGSVYQTYSTRPSLAELHVLPIPISCPTIFVAVAEMPVARRALIIGLCGPAIQVIGFVWLGVHLLFSHLHDPIDPRHLFFEGGTLMVGAGLLLSIVCIPVAIEVACAAEEDVAMKIFGKSGKAAPPSRPSSRRRHRLEEAPGSARERRDG
jgi:hypothetical protein